MNTPNPNPNLNLNPSPVPPPTPAPSDLPASTHHSSFIIHNSSLDTIITTVANFYRIPPSLARGACRDRKAAWPRQVAMTLCCEFFPHIPGTTISRAFRRAHSTLSYARQCVLTAQKNPRTRADLTRLRKLIHQKLSSDTS